MTLKVVGFFQMVLALNGKKLQRSVSEILQCKMRRFCKSKKLLAGQNAQKGKKN